MRPEVKERWVSRLRENPGRQAHGGLVGSSETGNAGECGLGALCMLAVEAGVIDSPQFVTAGFGTSWLGWPNEQGELQSEELPTPVMEWAGLDTPDPELTAIVSDHDPVAGEDFLREVRRPLSALNDDYELTFSQLADLIDDQL